MKKKTPMSPDDWVRQSTVLLEEGDPDILVYHELYDELFKEESAQSIAERKYTIDDIRRQIDEPLGSLKFFSRLRGEPVVVQLSYFVYHPISGEGPWAIVMPTITGDLMPFWSS